MSVPKEIVHAILSSRKLFITSHINLEPDALGSVIALCELLKKLKKKVMADLPDLRPYPYAFLEKNLPTVRFPIDQVDTFIVADCPNLERVGRFKDMIIANVRKIVNIDHHISNTAFGDANWVNPDASSTGEMIYDLFRVMRVPLTENAAEAIYSSILTDTGFFHYRNTTVKSLAIASQLRKRVCHTKITEDIFGNFSFSKVKLLGEVLSGMHISNDGQVSWINITQEMCRAAKGNIGETEGFIDYPRSIKGVKVAICFKEMPDLTKVSFRGRGVDVNKIAKHFGGGGHIAASGCEIKADFEKTKKMVLDYVLRQVTNHKKGHKV